VDGIHLAANKDQWRDHIKTVMKEQIYVKGGTFFSFLLKYRCVVDQGCRFLGLYSDGIDGLMNE
jgi:hypothetical protein